MSSNDVATIVGYVLFGISELLTFLPINTNGIVHSFIIGFHDSFKNVDHDIELAQNLIKKKPNAATIINTVATNPIIQGCVQDILENQHLIPQIQLLCKNQELQTLFHSINLNPDLLKTIIKNNNTFDNSNVNIEMPTPTPTNQ